MAEEPSTNAVIRAILDAARTYNPRVGEIIPTIGVKVKLGTGYRAEDIKAAFEEMLRRGWIEPEMGHFFKITQLGYEEM